MYQVCKTEPWTRNLKVKFKQGPWYYRYWISSAKPTQQSGTRHLEQGCPKLYVIKIKIGLSKLQRLKEVL
jgi:hypothetical protein